MYIWQVFGQAGLGVIVPNDGIENGDDEGGGGRSGLEERRGRRVQKEDKRGGESASVWVGGSLGGAGWRAGGRKTMTATIGGDGWVGAIEGGLDECAAHLGGAKEGGGRWGASSRGFALRGRGGVDGVGWMCTSQESFVPGHSPPPNEYRRRRHRSRNGRRRQRWWVWCVRFGRLGRQGWGRRRRLIGLKREGAGCGEGRRDLGEQGEFEVGGCGIGHVAFVDRDGKGGRTDRRRPSTNVRHASEGRETTGSRVGALGSG
ncbi:hypothetical protein FA13DRAFT_1712916 [Coprinellus micaceus]|uniref:Uncharacterized protein n=1 Tax=Coprinellus micaceus TaxID=71717 RepID=A0A4Y7T097_COPMI|nr:hypothetical protein FA13DRAFT_1712916 [Coprinellus micaceus]